MDDMISRQAAIKYFMTNTNWHDEDGYEINDAEDKRALLKSYFDGIPSAQQWIPIKMRPMDAEEREYWKSHFDYELVDEDAVMFDCKMPDDGQEILVSYRKWICMDKCEIDGGCYGLEGNGDWDGVVAWMPLPEPYEEEHDRR